MENIFGLRGLSICKVRVLFTTYLPCEPLATDILWIGRFSQESVMTSSEKRETLISEIGNLYSIQMASHHEAAIFGWTSEQSLLASDIRLARITSLVRQLAELDEIATRPPAT